MSDENKNELTNEEKLDAIIQLMLDEEMTSKPLVKDVESKLGYDVSGSMITEAWDTVQGAEKPVPVSVQTKVEKEIKVESGNTVDVIESNLKKIRAMPNGNEKTNLLKKELSKLVRVTVSPRDSKEELKGGFILKTGNNILGSVTKYIPYNSIEPYHISYIAYKCLQDKKLQIFKSKQNKFGETVNEPVSVNAYNIVVHNPLTESELAELSKVQLAKMGLIK